MSSSSSPRQLNLNAFIMETGHHEAAWRHPDSPSERLTDVGYFQDLARRAEAAKMDAIFFADIPGLFNSNGHRPPNTGFEPITLLAAIAAITDRIGLIATASTTFHEPYNLARLFNSLDHISHGRAGWNIVTTASEHVAANFGLEQMPTAEQRYERAQEFVDATAALWDSWEDTAVVNDREAGLYFDPQQVHRIDYRGSYVNVAGPLDAPRSPQGRPVYVQAGSSNEGRAFAAHNAEAIFTAHQTLADAKAFYADIKNRAELDGRNPDHVKVLPGLSPFIADSEREAADLRREYNELTVPAYGLNQLAKNGIDLHQYELDEPVPLELFDGAGDVLNNSRSRVQVIANLVERERPTVRGLLHLLAGGRGHKVVHGTPVQVADLIQKWFEDGAADGFNVMPPAYPQGLDAFAGRVIPILQERGLFRTEYSGSTLREHYGLTRPESRFAQAGVAAAVGG
jgi:FMN-dependent oxidoreductase (nitrilotriacetate monooxygenase family)